MHFNLGEIILGCSLIVGSSVKATPLKASTSGSHASPIYRRAAVYDASCSRNIPGSSATFQSKAEEAYGDAIQLAITAQNGKDANGNVFTESTAFSHYFGDGDKDQVKGMIQAIYDAHLPTGNDEMGRNPTHNRPVRYINTPDYQMVLCDRFFNANTAQTKQNLGSKMNGTRRGQWCQPDEQFPFFEVAGLTLLHEMTHLDLVGEQAGLSDREDPYGGGFQSHGTVDVYTVGTDADKAQYKNMDPWQAGRELHQLWDAYNADNSQYKPTTPVDQNAESYAAAALEFYFLNQCYWNVIQPN
ncbi:hypothetical protein SLS62_002632 [Diatrype stigma]|uniref:Uncharacterized protein n=1 Tax=Diatrype stigma TaxID=117547 RepID=A0AAN9YVI3_9PEZI